jgi:hypothetical protein
LVNEFEHGPRGRLPNVTSEARRALEGKLEAGEHVAWSGAPTPEIFAGVTESMMATYWVFFAFSLLFMLISFVSVGVGWLVFFGLGMVAFSVWVLLEPLRARRRAERTFYAVTNRRILILEDLEGLFLHAISPSDIQTIRFLTLDSQTGSIVFGNTVLRLRDSRSVPNLMSLFGRMPWSSREHRDEERKIVTVEDGLFGVSEPRAALDAIRALRPDLEVAQD